MASHRDVQTFVELRLGFQGMREFADAALAFLDKNGIAGMRAKPGTRANSNGASVGALIEKVKRQYTQRRPAFPDRPATPIFTSKLAQRRAVSAALLSQLDATEPRIPTGSLRSIGALVRRGYITRKANGYIRTAKEYAIKKARTAATTGEAPKQNAWLTTAEAGKILDLSQAGVIYRIKTKQLTAKRVKGVGAQGKKYVVARADVEAAANAPAT